MLRHLLQPKRTTQRPPSTTSVSTNGRRESLQSNPLAADGHWATLESISSSFDTEPPTPASQIDGDAGDPFSPKFSMKNFEATLNSTIDKSKVSFSGFTFYLSEWVKLW